MFGVLKPQRHSLRYRRLYARLCQHYRASYGLGAVLWLNDETVFLYAVALDLGLLPTASMKDQRCCRLRRDPALEDGNDHRLGCLLASIGLLLGSLKVDDDLRDKPGLASRLSACLTWFQKAAGLCGVWGGALQKNSRASLISIE